MSNVLVDTDVFVDHLRGRIRFEPGTDTVHYSIITRCELFAGQPADEDRVTVLLGSFHELGIDRSIAQQAGRLRRDLPIRTPDALIAATALTNGLTLRTRNRRDFDTVPGLSIESTANDGT